MKTHITKTTQLKTASTFSKVLMAFAVMVPLTLVSVTAISSIQAQTLSAPTAITVNTVRTTPRFATIPWVASAQAQAVTAYEVILHEGQNCADETPFTATVSGGSSVVYVTELLSAATDYSVQVRGVNAAGKGTLSTCQNFRTNALTAGTSKPGVVGGVTVVEKMQSSFGLRWTIPATKGGAKNADFVYDVYWDTDSQCTDTKAYGQAKAVDINYRIKTFRNGDPLSAQTDYWYAIRADNGSGTLGDWTPCTKVTTEAPLPIPTNLMRTGKTETSIKLGWSLPNILSQQKTENRQIPDGGGAKTPKQALTSTIAVSTQKTIDAITVAVDIEHPYRGDLSVELIAPSGAKVALHNQTGGAENNIKKTYSSADTLSSLIGLKSQGNWKLVVADHSSSDIGTLKSWTITIGDGDQVTDYFMQYFESRKACLDADTAGTDNSVGANAVAARAIDPDTRTATVENLSPNTAYWFRIRSSDGENLSPYTACTSLSTSRGLLKPQNMRTTKVGDDSVSLTWDLPNVFSKTVEPEATIPDNRRTQAVLSTIVVPSAVTIESISVAVDIEHTHIGELVVDLVTPGGSTIRLHDLTGGAQNDIETTYTEETTPGLVALLNTNAQGNWRLRVGDYRPEDTGTLKSWTLTIGDIASITSYEVEYFTTQKACQDTTTAGTTIAPVNVAARTAIARELTPRTDYWFRARSSDGTSQSAYSTCVSATTNVGVPTPENLRSTGKTDTSVALTWDIHDVFSGTDTESRQIPDNTREQSVVSTVNVPNKLTIDDISVSVDITHPYRNDVVIDLVTPGGTTIRLRDQSGGGENDIQETYTDKFASIVGSEAQGNWQLRVGDYGSGDSGTLNSWTLTIGDIDDITGYNVEYFTARKACGDGTTVGTVVAPINVASRTATATGLTPNTAYWFRVRSTDNSVSSPYSSCFSARTGQGLLVPKNFRSVASAFSGVTLAWDLPGIFSETKTQNTRIPDDTDTQSVVSTINVADQITIDAVSVSVDITHSFVGDLKIDLVAPNGSEIVLHNRTGSSRGNFTATYKTELNSLIGSSAQGNWKLRVGDYAETDDGQLNSWTLTIGDTTRTTNYQVERFTSQKLCAGTEPGTTESIEVNTAERTATVSDLAVGTRYWFRIRSTDGSTYSPYSACVAATTNTGLLTPTNLRRTATTNQSITLGWDLPNTFTQTRQVNAPIEDNSRTQSTTSVFTVPGETTIDTISVAVDITHPYAGDLKIDLVAPDGSVIVLRDRVGGSQDNIRETYTTQLATLSGDDAQGDWQLRVGDYQDRSTGTLRSWTLSIIDSSYISGYDLEQFSSLKACTSGTGGTDITSVNVGARTAVVSGLTDRSAHWYRIRSSDDTTGSAYTNCVSVVVGQNMLVPSNLRTTEVTDTLASLAWDIPGTFSEKQVENTPIADETSTQSVTSTITVPEGTVTQGMTVSVDIEHSYVGDLKVDLVAPDGTEIVLHERSGGGQNNLKKTYTDQLADYRGDSAIGQWQLRVGDYSSGDTGTLKSWTITSGRGAEITGYALERFTSQSNCKGGIQPITASSVNVESRTAAVTGLLAGTNYWFRVNSTDGTSSSDYSPCLSVTTKKRVQQQPTNFRSVAATDQTISLAWDLPNTFSRTRTENVQIEDGSGQQSTRSTITVPTGTSTQSLSVSVNITHPHIGDLKVSLDAPDGTTVVLHDRTGGTQDNLVQTYTEFPTLAGVTRSGDWRLRVGDFADQDVGTLNSWTLTIGDVVAATSGFTLERYATQASCEKGTGGTVMSVSNRDVTVENLEPSTTYWFRVRSVQDSGGNVGAFSTCVSASTNKPARSTLSAPTNLRSIAKTDTSLLMAWDIDNVVAYTAAPMASIADNTEQQDTISTISVTEDFSIESIAVSVDITHSNPQDLQVEFVVPGGKSGVTLHERKVIDGGNVIATYNGKIFNHLAGRSAQGDWQIRVGDYSAENVGMLRAWTLTFGDVTHITDYDLKWFTSEEQCEAGTGTDVQGERINARTAWITGFSPETSYWFRIRAYDGTHWTSYTDCVEETTVRTIRKAVGGDNGGDSSDGDDKNDGDDNGDNGDDSSDGDDKNDGDDNGDNGDDSSDGDDKNDGDDNGDNGDDSSDGDDKNDGDNTGDNGGDGSDDFAFRVATCTTVPRETHVFDWSSFFTNANQDSLVISRPSDRLQVGFWEPLSTNVSCAHTGSQVLLYLSEASCLVDTNGIASTASSTSQSPVFRNLLPETTYWLKARWSNSAGWGPFPAACTPVRTGAVQEETAPSAPRNLRGTPSRNDPRTELQVYADAPESDGGSPITGYELTVYENGCDGTLVATKTAQRSPSFNVDGLTKNTSYCLSLTATNAIGTSSAAEVTVETEDDTVPQAPIWNRPTMWHASASTVSVTWRQNNREKLPILAYELFRYSDSACTENEAPVSIPRSFGSFVTAHSLNLEPATTYYFKVRAKNRVGWGAYSPCQGASTREGVGTVRVGDDRDDAADTSESTDETVADDNEDNS